MVPVVVQTRLERIVMMKRDDAAGISRGFLLPTLQLIGFGVEQLRDDNFETYWQSDGQLPHLVNIQFRRKTTVHDVSVYTDFKLDESYTPSKISVR